MNQFLTMALVGFISVFSSLNAFAVDSGWTVVKKGKDVTTKRFYSDFRGDRQIHVQSDCFWGQGESTFGKCSHQITILPSKKDLKLKDGGESIFLTDTGTIASFEYGCCGAHNIVRFYLDDGTLLGVVPTYDTPKPTFGSRGNSIGTMGDYLLLLPPTQSRLNEKSDLWLIDPKKPSEKKLVHLNIPKTDCGLSISYTNSGYRDAESKKFEFNVDRAECEFVNQPLEVVCVLTGKQYQCTEEPKKKFSTKINE